MKNKKISSSTVKQLTNENEVLTNSLKKEKERNDLLEVKMNKV